jgi:hypothetical protein
MKKIRTILLLLPMLFAVNANASLILSLLPGNTSAMPGDTVFVDLVASGLTDGGADSLGAFDLDISYDSSAVSVNGITLSGTLGDFGLFEALDFSLGDDTFGLIGLSVVSLLSVAELDTLQMGSLVLATISFSVDMLDVGTSTQVGIDTIYGLSDAFGDELLLMGSSNATIRNGMQVDEPAFLALLIFPLLILMRRKLR